MKNETDICINLMNGLIENYELNAFRKDLDQLVNGVTRSHLFIEKLINQRTSFDHIAKYEGIYEYLYEDISLKKNTYLGRIPTWSFSELLPLSYPEE